MTDRYIKNVIKKLMELDDFTWGEILLTRDPMFYKMTTEEVESFIYQGFSCANSLFKKQIESKENDSPMAFAKHEGITIKRDDAPLMESYLYFGLFQGHSSTIEISSAALEKTVQAAQNLGLEMELSRTDLEGLVIAHEIFHYLEAKDAALFTRKAAITRPFLPGLKRSFLIKWVSELAAVRFSKLWLNLSFCPAIYDILLVHAVNPERARKLAIEQLQKGCAWIEQDSYSR